MSGQEGAQSTGEGSRNRVSQTLPYPKYVRRRNVSHCGSAYGSKNWCLDKNLQVVICSKDEGVPKEMKQSEMGEIVENVEEGYKGRECKEMQLGPLISSRSIKV